MTVHICYSKFWE